MGTQVYAFDPDGTKAANWIKGERHTITPRNGIDFNYIIPKYAPFFQKDFKVYTLTQQGTKKYLVEGVDFNYGYRFLGAIKNIGMAVYGAIRFVNRQYAGDIYLEYRTLGGEWTLDAAEIGRILLEWQLNPITTTWEQVVGKPLTFPVLDHKHDIEKFVGFDEVVKAIKGIGGVNSEQLDEVVRNALTRAMQNYGKANVGLGNVQNLPILPANQGSDRTDNYYMTPKGTIAIIDSYIKPAVTQATADITALRNRTPSDWNTYSKQEIDAKVDAKLDKVATATNASKLNNRNDVQLKSWILEGNAANSVKFNGLSYNEVKEDLTEKFTQLLNTRLAAFNPTNQQATNATRFNNRTDTQFAEWFITTYQSEINAGKVGGKTVNQIIAESRVTNAETLNGATKDQIITEARRGGNASTLGGETADEIVARAKQNVTFGGKTPTEYKDWILAQVTLPPQSNSLDPVTKAALLNEVRALTVDNTRKLEGKTVTQIVNEAKQNIDAARLNGKTVADIVQEARDGNVNNSARFDNRTFAEAKSEILAEASGAYASRFVSMGSGVDQKPATASANIVKIGQSSSANIPAISVDAADYGLMDLHRGDLGALAPNAMFGHNHAGIWRQPTVVQVTEAKGYPANGVTGILHVIPNNTSGVTQLYYPADDSAFIYKRTVKSDTEKTGWVRVGFDWTNNVSHITNGTRTDKLASEKALGDLRAWLDSRVTNQVANSGAVLTTTDQDISGLKDFKHSFTKFQEVRASNSTDSDKYARLGVNNTSAYLANAKSGKSLELRDSGGLVYDGNVVLTNDRIDTKMLDTEDLNTITTPGLYGQQHNVKSTSDRNYPLQMAGSLIVTQSAYGLAQIYIPFENDDAVPGSNVIWRRARANDRQGWRAWGKLTLTEQEVRTIVTASLGTYTTAAVVDSKINAAVEAAKTLLSGQIQSIRGDITTANSGIAGLRGELTPVKNDVATLKTQASTVDSRIQTQLERAVLLQGNQKVRGTKTFKDGIVLQDAALQVKNGTAVGQIRVNGSYLELVSPGNKSLKLDNSSISYDGNQLLTNRDITANDLSATTNLDTVVIPGLYGQAANVNATTERNYPVQLAGSLTVTPSAYGNGRVMQEYRPFNNAMTYRRNQNSNGTWGNWKVVGGDVTQFYPKSGGDITGERAGVVSSTNWPHFYLSSSHTGLNNAEYQFRNNHNVSVGSIRLQYLDNGSTEMSFFVTPSGAKTNDRRNKQFKISSSGLDVDGGIATTDAVTVHNGNAWPVINKRTQDGGNWRLEFNPVGATDKRGSLVFTSSTNKSSYIRFPTIGTDINDTVSVNVAYQDWVLSQIQAKMGTASATLDKNQVIAIVKELLIDKATGKIKSEFAPPATWQ